MNKDIFSEYIKRKKEAEALNKKIMAMDKKDEERAVLKNKLKNMNRQLSRKRARIGAIAENIDDCIIKKVVIYRYFDGLKWSEVAEQMGDCYCADTLRIMTRRYMDKNFFKKKGKGRK